MKETVEDVFKFIQKLNLIKNNVVSLLIDNSFLYEFKHIVRITQFLVAAVIQSHLYDVLLIYTFFQQVIVE